MQHGNTGNNSERTGIVDIHSRLWSVVYDARIITGANRPWILVGADVQLRNANSPNTGAVSWGVLSTERLPAQIATADLVGYGFCAEWCEAQGENVDQIMTIQGWIGGIYQKIVRGRKYFAPNRTGHVQVPSGVNDFYLSFLAYGASSQSVLGHQLDVMPDSGRMWWVVFD